MSSKDNYLVSDTEYFEIAYQSINSFSQKQDKVIKMGKSSEINEVKTPTKYKKAMQLMFESRQEGLNVILYSSMCLEALINRYGAVKTSSNYFNKYLDRLDTVSKWKVVPELVTGQSISSDGQAFELLQKLFKTRNEIVHFKPKKFSDNDDGWEKIANNIKGFYRNVYDSFEAVWLIILELKKIDPEFFKETETYKVVKPK